MAWSIPSTVSAGATILAATTNAIIADLQVIGGAWTSYTPTLTNITLGNGTLSCAYKQVDKTVTVRVLFTAGSSTTYSAGTLAVSLPVTPHSVYSSTSPSNIGVGAGIVNPAGSRTGVTVQINASPAFTLFAAAAVTNTSPATFGTSSVIGFTATYEAA